MTKSRGEKHFLTDEEIRLSTEEFGGRFGYSSRGSIHRAKARGWVRIGHYNLKANSEVNIKLQDLPPVNSLKAGDKVVLSSAEMSLSECALARRYKIGRRKAAQALKTGCFEVYQRKVFGRATNVTVVSLESAPEWTKASPKHYDPESRWFRVNLAPAECSYTASELVKLYASFGLTERVASKAKRKGYFCPNHNRPFEASINEELFEHFKVEAFESAKAGARLAAKKLLGADWHKNLPGITIEDLEAEALNYLYHKSGIDGFCDKPWRLVVAKNGALALLGRELKKKNKESSTVDELEGRFED